MSKKIVPILEPRHKVKTDQRMSKKTKLLLSFNPRGENSPLSPSFPRQLRSACAQSPPSCLAQRHFGTLHASLAATGIWNKFETKLTHCSSSPPVVLSASQNRQTDISHWGQGALFGMCFKSGLYLSVCLYHKLPCQRS